VHRLVGEEKEDCRADVAARCSAPTASPVERTAVGRAGMTAAGVVVADAGMWPVAVP
jgi:hypothetical protein